MDDLQTARVKWFNDKKGFGFANIDGDDRDIFIHHRDIQADGFRTLAEGQLIQLTLEDVDGKLKAIEVYP